MSGKGWWGVWIPASSVEDAYERRERIAKVDRAAQVKRLKSRKPKPERAAERPAQGQPVIRITVQR